MNTTQRKYAIERMKVLCFKKAREIEQQDHQQYKVLKESLSFNAQQLLKMVAEGVVKVKAADVITTNSGNLADLFVFPEQMKKANHPDLVPGGAARVYVEDPDSRYSSAVSINFKANKSRLTKLQLALQQASDDIMLGSQSEAAEAIKSFENQSF